MNYQQENKGDDQHQDSKIIFVADGNQKRLSERSIHEREADITCNQRGKHYSPGLFQAVLLHEKIVK